MSFHIEAGRPKARNINLLVAVVLVVVIVGVGLVYAVFFTQSIPTSTVPPETIATTCPGVLSTSSQATASSGALQYTCPGGSAAFTSIAGTANYTLTSFTQCTANPVTSPCYTNFGYVAHGDTTSCVAGAAIGPSFHPIAGVTPPKLTFTAGSWDYCAFYAAPSTGGSLPGFSIGWT